MENKIYKSVNIFLVLVMFLFCCLTVKERLFIVFAGMVSACIILFLFLLKEKVTYFSEESNIYEIIHDIKTPAAAELRATELLLKGTFGNINDMQKDILLQMRNSSEFMLNIINNISALCSYEHENINWSPETFDINEIIKMCIENLKYLSADKRCTLLFDYAEPKTFVFGVKTEITRVLLNLLTNAVKYSYPDRIITVTTKINGDKCVFTVNSFGETFDKSGFEKYNSKNKTGNGLGLYICDLILKKHNCKMFAESNNKTGNCFGFELKLAHQEIGNVRQ
ncbi:MAG: HAMP domain-containing histidine kinase [Candidatus Gastranaerophilales bacterium]|nr:HAMP domain-containing histidine kinase [Candidatus Gastranaerophilales bacterium]